MVGQRGDLVFHQFRQNQKIGVVAALVQSLNGQHVVPGPQRIQLVRDVDLLEHQRLVIRMRGCRCGIPLWSHWRVAARDLLPVQPGHKSVVVHHAQGE